MPAKLTQEKFLEKARAVHGGTYDYSEVLYTTQSALITIICRKHGPFTQKANTHLQGCGCPVCGKERRIASIEITEDEFVLRAKAKFGDKFDLTNVAFRGMKAPINVSCPEHGPVNLTAERFLDSAHGCIKCSNLSSGYKAGAAKLRSIQNVLKKFNKVHGDKYDYSAVVYVKGSVPITVICKTHGPFEVTPNAHIAGVGCALCSLEARRFSWKHLEDILKSKICPVSLVDVSDDLKTITAKCSVHGEFMRGYKAMINGEYGCVSCFNERRGQIVSEAKTRSHEEFIELALAAHGLTYSYDKTKYVNSQEPVIITCPEHGDFEQVATVHTQGKGCPKCGVIYRGLIKGLSTEKFIEKSTKLYGDSVDYSLAEVSSYTDVVTLICKKHGKVTQTVSSHLRMPSSGEWCPVCRKMAAADTKIRSEESFLERASERFGDTYQYKNYLSMSVPVTIVCPIHGEVEQLPQIHLKSTGCPVCGGSKSSIEEELCSVLDANGVYYTRRDRTLIKPKEVDIVCKEQSLAIEVCGVYWHSETNGKGPRYHADKLDSLSDQKIRLVTLFSDEWKFKQKICVSLLLSFLGVSNKRKIGGRQCEVLQASASEAKEFYESNHLHGFAGGTHLSLVHDGEIVSMATFGTRSIYGSKTPKGEVELIRFCTLPNVSVAGGLAKLVNAYAKERKIVRIVSYVDRRWFTGDSYLSSGFVQQSISKPGYWYVKGEKRYSRYSFAKHTLKNKLETYDHTLSEHANMVANGWHRIYDCGHLKMVKTL